MKTVVSVALIFLAAFAASCFDNDGNAQSGVTRAEFDALLKQVAALEANRPGDKVFAAASGLSAQSLAKATAQGRALGTALTFNGPAAGSTEVTLRSANGFLYAVRLSGGTETGPTNHEIFYEAAGCAGQGYIAAVSEYGAEQGYVFALAANGGTTWNDPAQFFYVPAGTKNHGPVVYNSVRGSLTECGANTGTIAASFAAEPNDPAITGVESGPIALPITIQ